MMRAAIFAIDTGAYKAKAESAAATALKRLLEQAGFEVKAAGILPQEKEVVESVTDAAERLLPGIPEALRAYNLRYSKKAILESMAAGIRNKTLVINLPESAKTAKEDMEYILPEVVQVVENISL